MKFGTNALRSVVFTWVALTTLWAQRPDASPQGVVIEKVAKNFEGASAGLQEGDVLLQWSRSEAQGEIRSPFDLALVEIEQAPRGTVTLQGRRGEESKVWSLGQDGWRIEVRPNLPQAALDVYRRGQEFAAAGKLPTAAERWRSLAALAAGTRQDGLAAWLLFHAAQTEAKARDWKDSDQSFQDALQASTSEPESTAQIQRAWADTFMQRNDMQHAEELFGQVLAKLQGKGSENLAAALILDSLGRIARRHGDLTKAQNYYSQAWRLREKLAPDSLVLTASLIRLGVVANDRSEVDKEEEFFRRALAIAEKLAPRGLAAAETLGALGDVILFDRGNPALAKEYYTKSLEIRSELEADSLEVGEALDRLGWLTREVGDITKGLEYHARALAIRERLAPGGLEVAQSLGGLCLGSLQKGELARAEQYCRQALAIREKLVPQTLAVAHNLTSLTLIAWQQGDLAKAEDVQKQALAIQEKMAPDGLDVAASLNNLGLLAHQRGDLEQGASYYQRALAIREKAGPDSPAVAQSLNNLGVVAMERGELAKAELYFHHALAIQMKRAPGALGVAMILNNLGDVAQARGDLSRAEEYQRRALAIRQKSAPGSLDVAMSLNNLGVAAWYRGDLTKADDYHHRALAIREKLAPNSLDVAMSLTGLGTVANQRGDLPKAEQDFRRALSIRDQLAPVSVDRAWNLKHLALVTESRGDLDEAEQCYRKALAIWEKLAPGSTNQADALAGLASIRNRRGDLDEAVQVYEQALNALEDQTARLGGSDDVRSGFRAQHQSYYREYIDLLLSKDKREQAFEVLERSRARTLLYTLASGRIDIRNGVDADLIKKERSLQADIKAKSERRIHLLAGKQSDELVRAVEREINALHSEYKEIEAQIRSSSPAYAALTQPRPLSAREVQEQLLDSETLLLEYSLGKERSHVFVVSTGSLEVFELPKQALIEAASRRVYELLTARNHREKGERPAQRAERIAQADSAYPQAAARLGRMVFGPIAGKLRGKRLLIVSDGALNYVSFAALPVRARGKSVGPLATRYEIVNLPSASVLAVLRQERQGRPEASKTVAVLADPVFDSSDTRVKSAVAVEWRNSSAASPGEVIDLVQNGEASQAKASSSLDVSQEEKQESLENEESLERTQLTRSAADAGWRNRRGEVLLPRLQSTRREAEAIVAVTAPGQSFAALDFKANRATATTGDLANYRIVHLATHALLNSKHPELSGLVLSLVDERGRPQSGFLGLEDIYNLNLPAELVVLSACETALGKDVDGEGMVGLTRGFMYAGASRVMASLWNIDDRATADQMKYFYRAMVGQGMRPAAALRTAQLKMRKDPRWSSPYFWAAFQIQGEWK
jgi:CHAT domain-containing protein/Tfp pilus assembly protein PilF